MDNVERLGSVPLFAACSAEELSVIAQAATEKRVAAGTTLCTHGEFGTDFYLLLEGEATVKRYGRRLALLAPGGSFGELALLTGLRRNATVVATKDSTLLVLSQADFDAVLDGVPRLAHKLLSVLAERVAAADALAHTR